MVWYSSFKYEPHMDASPPRFVQNGMLFIPHDDEPEDDDGGGDGSLMAAMMQEPALRKHFPVVTTRAEPGQSATEAFAASALGNKPKGDDGWRGPCAVCGIESKLRCMGCREKTMDYHGPYYCGKEHQTRDWKIGGHKKKCLKRTGEAGLDAADIVFSLDGDHRVAAKKGDDPRALTAKDLDGLVYARSNGTIGGSKRAGQTITRVNLLTVVELDLPCENWDGYKGVDVANVTLESGIGVKDTMFGSAACETWKTHDGKPMRVRDLVDLVMLRFRTKLPCHKSNIYCDTTRVTVLDTKTLEQRGADGRTFKLMAHVAPVPGTTYLTY